MIGNGLIRNWIKKIHDLLTWRTIINRPLCCHPSTSHTQAAVDTSEWVNQHIDNTATRKTHVNLQVLPSPHGAHKLFRILTNLLCKIIMPTRTLNVEPMKIWNRGSYKERHDIINIGIILLYGLESQYIRSPLYVQYVQEGYLLYSGNMVSAWWHIRQTRWSSHYEFSPIWIPMRKDGRLENNTSHGFISSQNNALKKVQCTCLPRARDVTRSVLCPLESFMA